MGTCISTNQAIKMNMALKPTVGIVTKRLMKFNKNEKR